MPDEPVVQQEPQAQPEPAPEVPETPSGVPETPKAEAGGTTSPLTAAAAPPPESDRAAALEARLRQLEEIITTRLGGQQQNDNPAEEIPSEEVVYDPQQYARFLQEKVLAPEVIEQRVQRAIAAAQMEQRLTQEFPEYSDAGSDFRKTVDWLAQQAAADPNSPLTRAMAAALVERETKSQKALRDARVAGAREEAARAANAAAAVSSQGAPATKTSTPIDPDLRSLAEQFGLSPEKVYERYQTKLKSTVTH